MATQWDAQNAKEQQQVAKTISNVATAGKFYTRNYTQPQNSLLGTIVETLGAFAIAGVSFLTNRKRQAQAAKIQAQDNTSYSYVDQVLGKLQSTGDSLVSQGIDPSSQTFETGLQQLLYKDIGYNGNCNIALSAPIDVTQPSSPRPIWLIITNNGTQLVQTNERLPANILSYWSSQCSSIHSSWIEAFAKQTTKTQQQQLISQDQSSVKNTTLIGGLVFGGVALGLITTMVYYSTKIK